MEKLFFLISLFLCLSTWSMEHKKVNDYGPEFKKAYPLHYAVIFDEGLVESLLKEDVDPKQTITGDFDFYGNKKIKSYSGWTALHLAVAVGSSEKILELLDKEDVFLQADGGGWRPFDLSLFLCKKNDVAAKFFGNKYELVDGDDVCFPKKWFQNGDYLQQFISQVKKYFGEEYSYDPQNGFYKILKPSIIEQKISCNFNADSKKEKTKKVSKIAKKKRSTKSLALTHDTNYNITRMCRVHHELIIFSVISLTTFMLLILCTT